jgi:hypothetical protein
MSGSEILLQYDWSFLPALSPIARALLSNSEQMDGKRSKSGENRYTFLEVLAVVVRYRRGTTYAVLSMILSLIAVRDAEQADEGHNAT